MSTPNRVKAKDFVEDGKKRIVFLVICAVGLSYLMSLTSSSVWVNLPVASSLVIILRYLSLDFEMKRKAVAYNSRPCTTAAQSSKKPFVFPKVVAKSDWREKVNSPVVEEAMDHFTRHLVSEWVTNLWYSRLTPDREGPEELAQIIMGLLGEISGRMRNINLIDLLISDLINLFCTHLEVFRATLAKIEKQSSSPLTTESRDTELKLALAADDKLHPALFSAEAEHKVLQHLMEGLMSVTFKHEDLQCSFIRCTARELLVHAVMRPVLNLASPRFLNERIESLVISKTKLNKGANAVQEASHSTEDRLKISSGRFTKLLDSSTGLELVQLGNSHSRNAQSSMQHNAVDTFSRDPLRSIDALLSLLWKSLPSNSRINDNQGVKQYHSGGGQRGDISDLMSQRRTQALAPEHFENMWTKGRNYENMGGEKQSSELVQQNVVVGELPNIDHKKATLGPKEKKINSKLNPSEGTSVNLGCSNQYAAEDTPLCADSNRSTCPSVTSFKDDDQSRMHLLMVDSGSSTSYSSEDDETSMMNSPGTKVWDGRRNRNRAVSLIHHPLEHFDSHSTKMNKIQSRNQRLHKTRIGWKRSSGHNMQEVKRTSFLSRDGQDIHRSSQSNVNSRNFSLLSDDLDIDNLGRIHSGGAACSSAPSISRSQSCRFAVNPLNSSLPVDSFSKLRCEVLCANIVKSGSRTFAVYSISVTDVNNRSWTIKRRFRHFEELHRHLKKFPDYNLQLPSKHFLSTGLDVTVVQDRCKLLDIYLKELMQLPIVSGSIEAWDFLSIDSQTYRFSNLLSIKTLSVDVDDKPSEKRKGTSDFSVCDLFASRRENNVNEINEAALGKEPRGLLENSGIDTSTRAGKSKTSPEKLQRTQRKELDGSIGVSDVLHDISDALPTEWVPPNLSVPILDLVDVIFQLQDGGWIRRKIFWVVKQILQLGMGDAFDDWLLDKIQLLRKGSVIASGISRVEQILWPDGVFITKHPRRRPPHGQKPKDLSSQMIADKQKREEDRRAKFVYELMIDHAPTAIVGLVGRKEYEQCARNLYFFLQSSVCLKQLAFDLIELLMVTAFPELDYVCKQLHEEKHKFGEFNRN